MILPGARSFEFLQEASCALTPNLGLDRKISVVKTTCRQFRTLPSFPVPSLVMAPASKKTPGMQIQILTSRVIKLSELSLADDSGHRPLEEDRAI